MVENNNKFLLTVKQKLGLTKNSRMENQQQN